MRLLDRFRSPEAIALQRIRDAKARRAMRLDLSNLDLTSLPPELGQLTQLRVLNLSNNRLTTLPLELRQLTWLEFLYLGDNELTTLPKELAQLSDLEVLHVQCNKLTTLPSELSQITKLKAIDLSYNALITLPPELVKLTELIFLHLASNRLTSLPPEMGQLKQLKHLFLHDNTQLNLPEDVLGPTWSEVESSNAKPKPPQDILAYYYRTQRAARPLNEVKLILVGRGGAGKTSIVRRLVEGKFKANESETQGIQISQWRQPCGQDTVRLNIWDFAGQEITHATHQFFLTARSVYVLVLTGRDGVQNWDAHYWLGLIRSFAGEAPVLVALNKQGQHAFDVDENGLLERYPFIIGFIKTDCQSGQGLAALKSQITVTVAGMESVRRNFPAEWVAIKERLAEMKESYLSYVAYQKLCAKLGEKDAVGQAQLSGCLHELGLALNYSDDHRLKDQTVLNPHWVTNGIYAILRAAWPQRPIGELHLADVAKVLPKEPLEMQRYLVELMRRFELCFPLANGEDTYLVPQKLPENQPELAPEWGKDPKALRLQYLYTAVPEGLLPRFLVRTYALSEGQERWRHGVVLALDAATALVRADNFKKDKVTVVVRGPAADQLRLVAIIRHHLANIHSDIKGLKPVEEIEMEGHPDVYQPVKGLEQGERQTPQITLGTESGDVVVNRPQELNRIQPEAARRAPESGIKVFVSYSKSDERHRARFRQHLTLLVEHKLIHSFWDDRCLVAGQEWDAVIQKELREAHVVVLLVSTAYLATPYVREHEIKVALERAGQGLTTVMSVILEPCGWNRETFAKYVLLPTKARPISELEPRAKGWYQVEAALVDLLNKLKAR